MPFLWLLLLNILYRNFLTSSQIWLSFENYLLFHIPVIAVSFYCKHFITNTAGVVDSSIAFLNFLQTRLYFFLLVFRLTRKYPFALLLQIMRKSKKIKGLRFSFSVFFAQPLQTFQTNIFVLFSCHF